MFVAFQRPAAWLRQDCAVLCRVALDSIARGMGLFWPARGWCRAEGDAISVWCSSVVRGARLSGGQPGRHSVWPRRWFERGEREQNREERERERERLVGRRFVSWLLQAAGWSASGRLL